MGSELILGDSSDIHANPVIVKRPVSVDWIMGVWVTEWESRRHGQEIGEGARECTSMEVIDRQR